MVFVVHSWYCRPVRYELHKDSVRGMSMLSAHLPKPSQLRSSTDHAHDQASVHCLLLPQ